MQSVSNVLAIVILACLNGLALGSEPQLELVLQTGHTDAVRSVALSGDGKYVATASYDMRAILWEAASGK